MTKTQRFWLEKLQRSPRMRLIYGAGRLGGMPIRTADALVRLNRAVLEWQSVCFKPGRVGFMREYVCAKLL